MRLWVIALRRFCLNMTTIEAVYEHGVFKPLIPPSLMNGQYGRIAVELYEKKTADDIPGLAAQVYEGLSDQDVNDIEAIALNRTGFFRKKGGYKWQKPV